MGLGFVVVFTSGVWEEVVGVHPGDLVGDGVIGCGEVLGVGALAVALGFELAGALVLECALGGGVLAGFDLDGV